MKKDKIYEVLMKLQDSDSFSEMLAQTLEYLKDYDFCNEGYECKDARTINLLIETLLIQLG